jgi:hypothetical protein
MLEIEDRVLRRVFGMVKSRRMKWAVCVALLERKAKNRILVGKTRMKETTKKTKMYVGG